MWKCLPTGFMIAIVRGILEYGEFEKAFQVEKMDIPRAPPLGLFLEDVSSEG